MPACSAIMYAAYHSAHSASLPFPIRVSYTPCAASARRKAAARSAAVAKLVAPEPIRPGSRAA